jgi:hypothetical protein
MLQLAAPAAAEMATRRIGMVRARLHGPIGQDCVARCPQHDVAARRGYAVTFGGNADNRFCFSHSAAA